ncbi:MAG: UDP-N-acetylmuramoyl-L-alanyl-D-glutamate--2,6-diaminopimelate ligase [Micrococcus sp.]|nr:UDP-N-acetylmuramoyl-L-alanyl-D-glutamate--2,6-diaminopimelate ligase [Micrococcus sp.]
MTETTPARLSPAEQDRAFRPAATAGLEIGALQETLRQAGIEAELRGEAATIVRGACLDSRVVQPGDLYIALPGARAHGAQFAEAAVQAGAHAVLTDAQGLALLAEAGIELPVLVVPVVRTAAGVAAAGVYGHGLDAGPTLLGVTGTNGKTTTTFLLAALLEALGQRTGVIGTILTRAGQRTVPSSLTTPESTQLHALMALMREEQVRTVAMEVSSHAVSFERISGLRYAVAGFTNLTQDHLDLHGSMQEYFDAKAALFAAQCCEHAVIVLDGGEGPEWGQRMAAAVTGACTTLSLGPAAPAGAVEPGTADWTITELTPDGLGHRFTLTHAATGTALRASVGLPGGFNVANAALAVLMVLTSLTGSLAERVATLAAVVDVPAGEGPLAAAVPGRMEVVSRAPDGVVDFAHNPDGMVQSLTALSAARRAAGRQGRTVLVFGATGDRDASKRALMGRIAVEHADVVIVSDDDPHSEDPASIRAAVLEGARAAALAAAEQGRHVEVRESAPRADAIRLAVELADEQDTILLAGRGHETAQDFNGRRVEIDDRVELRAALATRRAPQFFTDLSQPGR